MRAKNNPMHWFGLLLAWVFVALVIVPFIVLFTLAALMEFARTGSWVQANEKSAAMGKAL